MQEYREKPEQRTTGVNSFYSYERGYMMYFRIDQRLPSMNEVINANRQNKYIGAKLKREIEETIQQYISIARYRGQIKPVNYPVILDIKWHEKTKKRDVDNICSSVKFLLDALQKQGILVNDSRKYVKQIFHTVVDDTSDYVEVSLIQSP